MKTRTHKNLSNCLRTLLIAAVFAPAVTFASVDGGGSTGGGGGICINQHCMTLAEAGLAPSGTSVDVPLANRPIPAVSKELAMKYVETSRSLYKKAPFVVTALAISETDFISKFERVEVYNQQAIDRIMNQYKEVMSAVNYPTNNLELFAISNADKTYLLPKFYSLDATSQVLIMFHENLMRDYYKDLTNSISEISALKLILGFDNGILKLLNSNYSGLGLILEASMLRAESRRNDYLPIWAFTAERSSGRGYFRLDKNIFDDLVSNLRWTTPNESDGYSDISFWKNLNQIYPDLSTNLKKYGYRSLTVGNASFDTDKSYGLGYSLKDLAKSICINEKLESAFLTVLPSADYTMAPAIIVCKQNKLAEYATLEAKK